MMRFKTLLPLMTTLLFTACDLDLSVDTDYQKSILVESAGLACEEVFLSNGVDKITRTDFVYGERFFVNFSNMSGFERIDGKIQPGMSILMLQSTGDTVLNIMDVYVDEAKEFETQPLTLSSSIYLGSPFQSQKDYSLIVQVWDKNGVGTYDFDFKLDVKTNKHINIETKNLDYKEAYLFSEERDISLYDNELYFGETNYLILEGVSGFKTELGKVQAGMSVRCNNFIGKNIYNALDVIGDAPIDAQDVHEQLAAKFSFEGEKVLNPVTCKVKLWDKNSSAQIEARLDLEVK